MNTHLWFIFESGHRVAVGKWESCFRISTSSHGGSSRGWECGKSRERFPSGSWAAMGNLFLVFPVVHSPAFPQFFLAVRPLSCPRSCQIVFFLPPASLIAAPTSLSAPARRSSCSIVRSSFSDPAMRWASAAVFPTVWRTTCTCGSSCPCCLSSAAELHTAGESSDTD